MLTINNIFNKKVNKTIPTFILIILKDIKFGV
jgi:hypothetical protein